MDEGAASLSSSLFSSAQFNQAVFHNLVDCYPGGSNLECTYSLHGEIQHSEKDQVGVFQVGWQSISDAHLLKPAPKPSEPIWFNGHLLPKDGKMYQLCYVTEQGMIAGASVPFFFQSPDDSEWVAVENSDDDFVTVERNFSAMQTNNARLTLENQQLKDELIRTRNKLTRLVHLGQLNDKAPELTEKQVANFQLMCDLQKHTRPGKVISTPLENHFVAPKLESSCTTAKNEPAFLQKGSEDASPETKDSHNEILELAKSQPDNHRLMMDIFNCTKNPEPKKSQPDNCLLMLDSYECTKIPYLQPDNHQLTLDLNKRRKILGLEKLQPDIQQLMLDLMNPTKIPGPAKSQLDNYQLMLDLSKITKPDCRPEDDPSTEIFEPREEQPKDDILEAEGASSVSNEAVKANPSSQEDSRRTLDETTKDSQNNQAALNSLPLTDKANWFCNGGEHHVGLSCNLSWLKNFMVEEYNIPEEEVSVMIDSFCQEFERLRRKLNSKEQKPLEKDEKEDTNVTEQAIWPLNTRNFPSSSTYLSLIRNFMVEEYGMPEQDVLPMINSFYREIETLRRKFNSKEQAPLEKEGTNEESHAEEATMAEASGSSSTSTSTDDVQEVSETIKQPTTSGSEVKCDAQGFKCGDDNSNPSPPMGESSNTAPRTVRRPWLHIARKYNGPRPFVFGRTSMEQMMDGWHPNPILAGRRRLMQTEKIQALEAEIAGLQSYIQELESTKQPSSAERGDHLDDIVLVLSDELAKVELENKKLKETVDRFMAGSTERLEAHSTEQRGTSVADDMEQRGSVTNRESLVNKATQSEEEGVPETFKHAAQNYVGNCNLGWRNRSLIGCLNDVRTPLHAVLSQPVVPGTRFEFQVRTLPHCKNFTIKLGYDQSRFPLQATISTDMIDLSCQGSSLYGEKHDLPQDLRPDTCYALIFVVNSDSIEITIQSHSGATLYWNEYRPSVPVTEIQYVHVDGNVVVCDATLKEADNACCLEMRERLRRAFVEYVDLSYRYSLLKSKLESAQKKDL
ncbi:unnamed protein product [Bemisia tabaci]|uniref:SKICH domain-containing protein n=1 Tax=Bemisia tabaci TaxID=7038 RepID=A0A9P0G2T2_BEMTA|nr:unnamed protein product [Bemisia tabaci]